jgi:hypothetical protein
VEAAETRLRWVIQADLWDETIDLAFFSERRDFVILSEPRDSRGESKDPGAGRSFTNACGSFRHDLRNGENSLQRNLSCDPL